MAGDPSIAADGPTRLVDLWSYHPFCRRPSRGHPQHGRHPPARSSPRPSAAGYHRPEEVRCLKAVGRLSGEAIMHVDIPSRPKAPAVSRMSLAGRRLTHGLVMAARHRSRPPARRFTVGSKDDVAHHMFARLRGGLPCWDWNSQNRVAALGSDGNKENQAAVIRPLRLARTPSRMVDIRRMKAPAFTKDVIPQLARPKGSRWVCGVPCADGSHHGPPPCQITSAPGRHPSGEDILLRKGASIGQQMPGIHDGLRSGVASACAAARLSGEPRPAWGRHRTGHGCRQSPAVPIGVSRLPSRRTPPEHRQSGRSMRCAAMAASAAASLI